MSNYFDVTLGNDRRKAALQQLLQQYGGQSNLGQAMTAMPLFGGGRGGRSESMLPAAPLPPITVPFPINPGMRNALGPGGAGPANAIAHGGGGPGISGPVNPILSAPRQPGMPVGGVSRMLFGFGPNTPNPRNTTPFSPFQPPLGRGRVI